jgi:hypothetical protein
VLARQRAIEEEDKDPDCLDFVVAAFVLRFAGNCCEVVESSKALHAPTWNIISVLL